jgi:imidazolonepropionase-like amidohydrolase
MKLIKNGLVYTMSKDEAEYLDLLIDGSVFVKVEPHIEPEVDWEVIDAAGMNIFPGFIDAHSHLGMQESAIGFEGQDTNEMTDILTPHLRAIDGINPMDITFKEAALGGVTTVGTGPGSANVLGGTFCAIKTVGHRVDDMVINDCVAMKCAFGENPKRCYKDKNNFSRMSTAAKLREMLIKAKEYDEKKQSAKGNPCKMPKWDMKLEALLPVIHKEIPLKAHAHQANDIFTAIRIAKEFDVRMTLEHVTDGALIAEELAQEKDFMLAVGPSLHSRSKFECRNLDFNAPAALSNAGIPISIITDAPVVPQQYLAMCAGLAVQAGMKPIEALKAITINPARHLGVDHRVGSIEVGKDADLVIVDGSPFEILDTVSMVFVNGERVTE